MSSGSETGNWELETGNPASEAADAGRTAMLSLAVSCRSIGKGTSVDRMEDLGREYPAGREVLEELAEVLPSAVGRMLSDLLDEFASLYPKEREAVRLLRAGVIDPRSFRAAADAVELVANGAPNEILFAYTALPDDRWPKGQICDAGLFSLGMILRGVGSIRPMHGELWIADAHLSVPGIERAVALLRDWHRTYATAAFAEAQAQARAQDPEARPVPVPVPVPVLLPPAILLSEDQADKLGSLLLLSDGHVHSVRRLEFRRMVAAALFVFLRLLQRPYAVVFQSGLLFEPAEGDHQPPTTDQRPSSSFLPPRTVRVGTDGDLWSVVRALATALDHSMATGPGLRSEEEGPVRAFGEAVGRGTGRNATEAFADFTVAYLQVLVGQQGVFPKAQAQAQAQIGTKVVQRLHGQYLELLLDEQKRCLFREGKRIGSTRTENLVTAGVGAAGLPLLAWLLPKAAG